LAGVGDGRHPVVADPNRADRAPSLILGATTAGLPDVNPPTQNTEYEYLANNVNEKRSTLWLVFQYVVIAAVIITFLYMVRP
jgi:hypothetical protein